MAPWGSVWRGSTSRRLFFAVLLLFAVVLNVGAQQLSVSYLEGRVALQSGSNWTPLSIGDSLSADNLLRLSGDAYVELDDGGSRIILSRPGTYSLRDLVFTARKMRASGVGQALSGVLQNLISAHAANQGTTMGARGANESRSDQSDWVSSDAQVFLDAGKEYIESGEYQEAIEQFQQALDVATAEELPEVKYYLASAYSLSGGTHEALAQIKDLQPTGGETWAPDFVLLKAKLYLETNAFKEELDLLSQQGGRLGQDAKRAQLYYFLLALGYQGVADAANERQNLSKAISLYPGSDVGKAAAKLMGSL